MPTTDSINLHPNTHLPSSLKSRVYDVICLGSGWAGRVAAARCVAQGLTAIVVERELIGGDCPFWACVPSKALLRPAEALEGARKIGGAKERLISADVGVDVQAVFQRRDAFTSRWEDTSLLVPLVERSGAVLVRGTGKITGEKKVVVDNGTESVELEARHAVVLSTGSEPIIPKVPGLAEAKPWTPREATSSSIVPEHLVVLGGGVVGCEMATAYSSFGAKVTIVHKTTEILPRLDPEAGKLVRESLARRGVTTLLSTTITAVQRSSPGGAVTVKLSSGESIIASEILVAVGRRPVTQNIGLEMIGLQSLVDSGSPLPVDESLRLTAIPGNWLYAAGDINGRALLTHTSKYHGRIAANSIIARAKGDFPSHPAKFDAFSATADLVAVPQVIFTSPTVTQVGLTRSAAQREGRAVREITAAAATLGAKLHADGYEDGWAQWIVGSDSGVLLGATIVGQDAADLLHASTVAIVGGLKIEQLVHAIPSFPTMSEVYLNLIDAAGL
ncbi:putative oxidoreductase [Stipitochalara longipes BDJ]|nr:putative oxidoreductase [Stipitochalara longipes BDJ]